MAKTSFKKVTPWHKHFTTVTPLSRIIAYIVFILMPFIGFYLGMHYQKSVDQLTTYSAPIVQLQEK